MRTIYIQYSDDESSDSIARRIVYAFNVGNVVKIRDRFFKVTGLKSIVGILPTQVVGDNYTQVVQSKVEAATKPSTPAPKLSVVPKTTIIPPKSEPPHEVRIEPAGKSGRALVGQKLRPKDPRRKGEFTVVNVDGEHIYSDDGRKVSLSRLSRYEFV